MDSKDKGKRKIIQPTKPKKSASLMSISSEEEKKTGSTDKLMQTAINAQSSQMALQTEKIHSHIQGLDDIVLSQYTQSFNQGIKTPAGNRPSKHPQIQQVRAESIIAFGNYQLQKCYDINRKFRPMGGMNLTEKQQCLLDNLWHIQTMPQASNFKVQVLNALSIYFQEQTQKIPEKQNKRFSHYVIFRGTKLGIFNKWETVAKHIQCRTPLFKGYYSFSEAMNAAKEQFGLEEFYIEPEEVKTFSEMAKTNPEQIIKAQEEVIAKLQEQLIQSGKNTQNIQSQIEMSILKQKNAILEAKNTQLQQMLKKGESKTVLNRDFNSFKARILDLPWRQTIQPVLDRIPELEHIMSENICIEFPIILYELQQQIIHIAFHEEDYKGITVVQRTHEDDNPCHNRLLLQINLNNTDITEDQILNFYHHGMIDYLEFSFSSKTEAFLNKLGEKFLLTAGNMASYSEAPKIGCKIFASFPEANGITYRPARKRIFLSHRKSEQQYLKKLACIQNLCFDHMGTLDNSRSDIIEPWILHGQETPKIPSTFRWSNYKLLAEGHYIQLWSHHNWDMFLPFVGESDYISALDIINQELSEPTTPQSVDSTHRDF